MTNRHVKALALIPILITSTPCATPQINTKNQQLSNEHISLAKGEIISIALPNQATFTVANKEVISVKPTKRLKELLIKAKSLGISDLIVWSKDKKKKPKHYHVSVVAKRTHQKVAYHILQLKQHGLSARIIGQKLNASGELLSLKAYKILVKVKRSLGDRLSTSDVFIKPRLKTQIYTLFLERLMKEGITNLNCELTTLAIDCFETKEMKPVIEGLAQSFLINSLSSRTRNMARQFKVSLTLQQFESSDGQVFSLGLDKIESNWQSIIETNPLALINNNTIQVSSNNYKSETIAKPEIVGRLEHPIKVRIGQEISFFQNNPQGNFQNLRTRQWRFAGLALDIKINTFGEDLQVEYKNTLSKPEQEIISTNSQKSSIIISPGSSQVLFDIGFQTNQQDLSKFPMLSSIPVLGTLFKNSSKSKTYKKILCLIKIEEL